MNRTAFFLVIAAWWVLLPGGVLADAASDEARIERQRLELLRLQKAREKPPISQSRRRRRSSRSNVARDHLLVPVPAGWVTVDKGAETGSVFSGWKAYRTGSTFHQQAEKNEFIRVEQFRKAPAPGPDLAEAFRLWEQNVLAACADATPVSSVEKTHDGRRVMEGKHSCGKDAGQNLATVSVIKILDGDSIIHVIARQAPDTGKDWVDWLAKVRLGAKAAKAAASTSKSRILPVKGYGFYVSRKGHGLTNHTQVSNCRRVKFLKTKGVLVASDPERNLALFEPVKKPEAVGTFRDGAPAGVGTPVAMAGLASTEGKTPQLSALTGPGGNPRFVTLNVPVLPGSSGLALVGPSGLVAGMGLADPDMQITIGAPLPIEETGGYAINPRTLRDFLESQGIVYETAGLGINLTPAQAVEKAQKITVSIECWK
ncbi:MAG: trypsin-like peptidase domain-containing protein [Alphaproteobacteria bacterium]|nr:trypsin-like peptidase domain-containing protein [Alphaproteobacteria bacterium]